MGSCEGYYETSATSYSVVIVEIVSCWADGIGVVIGGGKVATEYWLVCSMDSSLLPTFNSTIAVAWSSTIALIGKVVSSGIAWRDRDKGQAEFLKEWD